MSLRPPNSYIAEVAEDGPPRALSRQQPPAFLPGLPQRQHLLQSILIQEYHEQAAAEGLVAARFAFRREFEKVFIRKDVLFLDLRKPLHAWDLFYRSYKVLYRPDRLQHDGFLGNKVVRLGLEPHAARLHGALQSLEPRSQPLGLPLPAWKVMPPGAATPLATGKWLAGIGQDQERTFRHRRRPPAPRVRPVRASAIASAALRRWCAHRRRAAPARSAAAYRDQTAPARRNSSRKDAWRG